MNTILFTKEDIITADKIQKEFTEIYYKADVIYLNEPMCWRDKWFYPPFHNMPIILSGHSDYPMTDNLVEYFNPRVWYAANNQTTKSNVVTLPLGITNEDEPNSYTHKVYGNLDIMVDVMRENRIIKNLVYMNFSIHTYPKERQVIWNNYSNKEWVTTGTHEVSMEGRAQFLRDIRSHSFVFCPRGNGLDTHRLWETLYMGSIPIVMRDIGYSAFEDLPILFVDDWDNITPEFLEECKKNIEDNMMQGKYNMEKLKVSYWINHIKKTLLLQEKEQEEEDARIEKEREKKLKDIEEQANIIPFGVSP